MENKGRRLSSRRGIGPGLLTLLSLALVVTGPARARDLYRYVDEQGSVHFSDVPHDSRYVAIEIGPSGRILEAPKPKGVPSGRAYDAVIVRAARRHGVPAALIKAVVATESNFDPGAVSPKGAQGLMQLMPQTTVFVGVANPFGAEENVSGGTRYLRWLIDRYGDWRRALAAYNAGPSSVDRYRGVPPYRETRAYVRRVLQYYRLYHGDFLR